MITPIYIVNWFLIQFGEAFRMSVYNLRAHISSMLILFSFILFAYTVLFGENFKNNNKKVVFVMFIIIVTPLVLANLITL